MQRKNISNEKIIQSFLDAAFEYSAGATSLSDVADILEIKKASLYNHFQSKDEIYKGILQYCSSELALIAENNKGFVNVINERKITLPVFFKKYVNNYFNIFEEDPLFKVYVFIHTEQFFNLDALEIVKNEQQRLIKELEIILKTFSQNDQLKIQDKEIKDLSRLLASYILEKLDSYLVKRKETMRQNPESGVGTLFSLPTDNTIINEVIRGIDIILRGFKNE